MKKNIVSVLSFCFALCWVCGNASNAKAEDLQKNKGNLRYSITVTKFENKAGWSGTWDMSQAFSEIMTNALNESGWFIVIGEKDMRNEAMAEQDFAQTGRVATGKKVPKIGRMTPAQLLVKGVITHVQSDTSGGSGKFNFKGISLGGSKDSSEVNITMYLVHSDTGQVAASTKIIGTSEKKGLGLGYIGDKLGGLRGDVGGFKNDNVGKACEDAVGQGVQFLIEQIQSLPWEGTILLAKQDKIIINRGSREGVAVGNRFDVGSVEILLDEDTGEVLDEEMTKVATIEVVKVKEKICYCRPISAGCNNLKKGMAVHPAE